MKFIASISSISASNLRNTQIFWRFSALTIKWEDGNEYPLAKIETSSESHPFYTGTQKIMDTAGRVEKFRQKFGSKAVAKATGDGAAKTAEKKAAAAEAKAAEKSSKKKA